MPYISSEEVKRKREAIKAAFPEFKFSITREHHFSINVKILAGPIDFSGVNSVNHFWIDEHFKDNPEQRDMLKKLYSIMNAGNGVEVEDGDYGTVPNFYTHIGIGDYTRPFQFTPPVDKSVAPIAVSVDVSVGELELVDYSEKAVAVFGDTKPIKDMLISLGGRFNPHLTKDGVKKAGWIFSAKKKESVNNFISSLQKA